VNRRAFAALVRKDLLLELRGSEVVLGMLTFVVAAFVLFRFGLGGGRPAGGTRAATGMLWVAIVFTAMLGLSRTFAQEREHGIWDGLLAAPIDRALQVVALPAFWLFFLQSGPAPDYAVLVAAVVLADVGIAALGTLVAGLASAGRAREVLLPVLFLPFAIPLVLGAVSATTGTISPQTSGLHTVERLGYLALYDTVFVLFGWGLFEFVVED
jgi:heme exporter protein B